MSWIELSSKSVKTRKPHICHCCGKMYSAGNVMQYSCGVNDGDFFDWYSCLICESFIATPAFDWKYHEEGLQRGELWEYREYKPYRMTFLPAIINR